MFTLTDPRLPAAVNDAATREPDDSNDLSSERPHRYSPSCTCPNCLDTADQAGDA